jgi:calcineurin-like phosphoesterase family protein
LADRDLPVFRSAEQDSSATYFARPKPSDPAIGSPGSPDPGPVVFAGDPHRNFTPMLRACLAMHAGTLIIVGDCDCPAPLPRLLAPLLDRGWEVRWILGNHDTETEAAFDNLCASPGDIGLRVSSIGGLRIAGLPGVFKPRVWYPRPEPGSERIEPPSFTTRATFLASLRPHEVWRGGLPLWHRDTVFPEDFDLLRGTACDILVTHEAPSSHPHGFAVIDALAATCGARLIVHGHHHTSYEAVLPNGIRVRGLGLAELWPLDDPGLSRPDLLANPPGVQSQP